MKTPRTRRESGFTLIELAVVLVIIGLIIGGILQGQALIASARIDNLVNDMNGLSASLQNYRGRFKQWPGDDPNATTRFPDADFASNTAMNGDGDGEIEGTYNDTSVPPGGGDETLKMFLHLRGAGLIPGSTDEQPGGGGGRPTTNPFGGLIGVDGDGAYGLTGIVICTGGLPPEVASELDTRLDDGTPNRGNMRGGASANGNAGTTPDTSFTGAVAYTMCRKV